jgi:uncharacterized protein (TIGR03435 family)
MILGLTNAPLLRAQVAPDLRFEVASVRRVEIPTINGGVPVFIPTDGIGTSNPHRITYHGAQPLVLIAEAFGIRVDQITGQPQWLGKERYDIVANIPDGATKEQFNVMLGNLLRDRFHLRFHMGSKTLPVYALRVAKGGPKFKPTARRADADPTPPCRATGNNDAQGFPILPANCQGTSARPLLGEIFMAAQDAPLANLVGMFESPLSGAGRPIVDETGLAGHYDFKIHFEYGRRPANVGDAPSGAPSIFTAVEEQLGLKLESATHSFPQFIIDSIDRDPTDN